MTDQELQDFSPDSGGLSPQLLMFGDSLKPGARISIKEKWTAKGVPFISLGEAGNYGPMCMTVQWVTRLAEGDFAILQLPGGMWDIESGAPPESLVKVDNGDTLVLLAEDNFERLFRAVLADREDKYDWPAHKLDPYITEQVQSVFGRMPAVGSPEHKALDPQRYGLTSLLSIGIMPPIEPGRRLRIKRRWQEGGFLTVALGVQGGDTSQEFSLRWFFHYKKSHCAILLYPPDMTADDDVIPHIAVRVVDGNFVETLSPEEVKTIALDCFREMERVKHCSPEDVKEVLGHFPTWEEARQQASAPG